MLYIISLGLFDKKDISVKGLEISKKCDILFIERYTNYFGSYINELEDFFGKQIKELSRNELESKSLEILEKSKNKYVGILIPGDCFSATTHISLLNEAKKLNIEFKIIHGSSILTAVGETGLSLYNFGKITTIPFDNKNIKSPIEVLNNNLKLGMHTLFLLDVKDSKYMNIKEGIKYLIENKVKDNYYCVGCASLGSENSKIVYSTIKELMNFEFKFYPQCFIIPGKLHFAEEETLNLYSLKQF